MKSKIIKTITGIGMFSVLIISPLAQAGIYADELSKCLVKSTTADDKTLLVQWIFAMMSLHPKVSNMASIPEGRRVELSKGTATLFQTLLTKTCLAETKEALKYEGPSTIEVSFTVLGQVATRELMTSPNVAVGLSELDKYIDKAALQTALRPQQ